MCFESFQCEREQQLYYYYQFSFSLPFAFMAFFGQVITLVQNTVFGIKKKNVNFSFGVFQFSKNCKYFSLCQPTTS